MSDERRVSMPAEEIKLLKERMGEPKTRYTVEIKRVVETVVVDRDWTTVGQKPYDKAGFQGEQPARMVDDYGYVDRVKRSTDTVTLYTQTVDGELNIKAVISAVNGGW